MTEQTDIKEIAQSLASVDVKFRQKGLKALKAALTRTNSENFKKISVGLFYYYWYSDGLDNQLADRALICSLLDLIAEEDKIVWLETFITTFTELWEGLDHHRIDKYLKLLREWFSTSYSWINKLAESRKLWVQWNDFLSTAVLYNTKGSVISHADRPTVFVRAS